MALDIENVSESSLQLFNMVVDSDESILENDNLSEAFSNYEIRLVPKDVVESVSAMTKDTKAGLILDEDSSDEESHDKKLYAVQFGEAADIASMKLVAAKDHAEAVSIAQGTLAYAQTYDKH